MQLIAKIPSFQSKILYGRKDLRYNTSCSYMTDENILNIDNDVEVILGFSKGLNNYSFDAIYPYDAHTPFYGGDSIYNDLNCTYLSPSTLESETDNKYNEVVVNTLGIDDQGNLTKLQPDYIVYIEDKNNINNNTLWEKSKKVASEFNIPIVVVDKEKIKQSEESKIADLSSSLKDNSNTDKILKFAKRVEHYISRYGIENIKQYVPQDKLDFLKNYIEQNNNHQIQNKN